jgi:hypothetical protein
MNSDGKEETVDFYPEHSRVSHTKSKSKPEENR